MLGVWRDLRHAFWPLLLYDLFLKAIGFLALAPTSAWLFARLVAPTGHLALGNEQILAFFVSLRGLLAIVVLGTAAVAFMFIEQAGLMFVGRQVGQGEKSNLLEAIWLTTRKLPVLIRLGALITAAHVLAALPFLALGWLTYEVLLSDYDINFLLADTPPRFWVAVSIGLVLLLSGLAVQGVLFFRRIFALPIALFGGGTSLEAVRGSREAVRGRFWRVSGVVLVWMLIAAAAPALITAVFEFGGGAVLMKLGENLSLVLPAVVVFIALYSLGIALTSFVALAVYALLIVGLYNEHVAADAERPSEFVIVPRALRQRLVFGAAVMALTVATVISIGVLDDLRLERSVEVTAHRGSSARAPENTISAVEAAIEDGADFAEIDVQETADGVVVVLHDEDLLRLAGDERKIWEITYAELSELDVGAWFDPAFEGERVPRLAEMIEIARDRIQLNIELKYTDHEQELAERVVSIVQESGFETQSIVTSLNYTGLTDVKRLEGRLDVGYIVFTFLGNISNFDVDFLSVRADRLDADLVARAHAQGKGVHVWTVNSPRQMSAFIDLGVDNIITDYPDLLIAMLAERASLSQPERVLLALRNWLWS